MSTFDFVVLMVSAVMSAASLVLHAMGRKSAKAEALAEDVDAVEKFVPAAKPADPAK